VEGGERLGTAARRHREVSLQLHLVGARNERVETVEGELAKHQVFEGSRDLLIGTWEVLDEVDRLASSSCQSVHFVFL